MAKPTDNQDITDNQNKITYQQQIFAEDDIEVLSELLISPEEFDDSSQLDSFGEYELPDTQENPFLSYREIEKDVIDKSDDPLGINLANEIPVISDDHSYSPFAEPEFSSPDKMFIGDELEDFNRSEKDSYEGDLFTNNVETKQESDINQMSASAMSSWEKNNDNKFDYDYEAFTAAFDGENEANMTAEILISDGEIDDNREVLNDLDEVDNLNDISGFEIIEDSSVILKSSELDSSENIDQLIAEGRIYNDQELFTISADQKLMPVSSLIGEKEANVALPKKIFAAFENASLEKKQWWIAGTVGVVSVMAVVIVSALGSLTTPVKQKQSIGNTNWFIPVIIPLTAGVTGAATAWFMTNFMVKKISRTTRDLQNQFHAMGQGNLNVAARVYSEDELGQLATGFNQMVQSMVAKNETASGVTVEKETKDNLQGQVIRLLDEVEGAAKGDLTVRAEVTDEGLGAVADAFNLIIQNLRDIVQQVKLSANEVTKAASNSEAFASKLSLDALGQAEELALALNSVQVMNNSIQRVAEAAKEAETVAGEASKIAQT
ncbi:MAG: HAMP domain-containing protein, partial [Dolichospermum sp.]